MRNHLHTGFMWAKGWLYSIWVKTDWDCEWFPQLTKGEAKFYSICIWDYKPTQSGWNVWCQSSQDSECRCIDNTGLSLASKNICPVLNFLYGQMFCFPRAAWPVNGFLLFVEGTMFADRVSLRSDVSFLNFGVIYRGEQEHREYFSPLLCTRQMEPCGQSNWERHFGEGVLFQGVVRDSICLCINGDDLTDKQGY